MSRLERVELGADEDGDPIATCVVVPVDGVPVRSGAAMTKAAATAVRALRKNRRRRRRGAGVHHIPSNVKATLDRGRTSDYRMGIEASGEARAQHRRSSGAYEQLIGSGIVRRLGPCMFGSRVEARTEMQRPWWV